MESGERIFYFTSYNFSWHRLLRLPTDLLLRGAAVRVSARTVDANGSRDVATFGTDVVRQVAAPWQVLSALLGFLELARLGELRVAQPRPFANVEISRDPTGEAA